MATELRWALIVISALVIGGLLIHGLWSVRKKDQVDETDKNEHALTKEPKTDDAAIIKAQEPEIGNIQLSAIDDDLEPVKVEEPKIKKDDKPVSAANEFIILHISMPEGLVMAGSKLLPCVLSLGFKISEEGFFNRHVEPSGQGPVMFRMVNMFNPGTFDVDNMEQFSTAGVSLFMTLPCEGDSLAAFNMLHSAAKKIAEEFGAEVLDSNREPLSVATVRSYVEKVREYAA